MSSGGSWGGGQTTAAAAAAAVAVAAAVHEWQPSCSDAVATGVAVSCCGGSTSVLSASRLDSKQERFLCTWLEAS